MLPAMQRTCLSVSVSLSLFFLFSPQCLCLLDQVRHGWMGTVTESDSVPASASRCETESTIATKGGKEGRSHLLKRLVIEADGSCRWTDLLLMTE